MVDADRPRCCFGDLETAAAAAARLLLLAAGTAVFLGLVPRACDLAGDFGTGDDLDAAAGERALPRVTRFSADDGGVLTADRLELRGILAISAIQQCNFCNVNS